MLKDLLYLNLNNSAIIDNLRSKFLFLDREGTTLLNLTKCKNRYIVYCIENLKNGKRYIGKTVNILNRANHYIKAYRSPEKYTSENRPIQLAISSEGIENFRMYPVYVAKDREELGRMEYEFIIQWNLTNPKYGYNVVKSIDAINKLGKGGHSHTIDSKITRSKLVACINPKTKEFFVSIGMKLFGDYIDTSKDIVKNNAKRGSKVFGFYVIYLNKLDRQDIKERRAKKYQYFLESCARLGRTPEANDYEEYLSFVDSVDILMDDHDISPFTDEGYTCKFLKYNENPDYTDTTYEIADISEFLEILDAMYNNDED